MHTVKAGSAHAGRKRDGRESEGVVQPQRRGRAERRADSEEQAPRRKSAISDALRWMDDAAPPAPAASHPEREPVPAERVAKGRRPVQVKKAPPASQSAAPAAKSAAPAAKSAAPARKSKRGRPRADDSEPALEPIRKRPRSGEQASQPTPAAGTRTPSGRWGEAARPPRSPVSKGDLDRALSWMDSAETRPLPDAPPAAPAPGERPRTGKVEAVLSWMDDLSGPFEEVQQARRPSGSGEARPRTARRPAASSSAGALPRDGSSELAREGSSEARRPTGKLKREAVSEILARADRVRQTERARSPAAPPPSAAPAGELDLGPPEEGFGPLSASDVWMLAQTPEDVLAGARRPRDEAPEPRPVAAALPPLPPPLPQRVGAPPPPSDHSDLQRATRRARVEEVLEWTQDLLGDDESRDDHRPRPDARTTDVFELALELPEDDPPEPDPPSRRSSRLLRLQEQLRARGELDAAASWSTLPDTDALAKLQAAAAAALSPPDPFQDDPLAELDPYAAVLPPVADLPRDPRCRDPFCMDPRCLQGGHGAPAAPAPAPAPPRRPGSHARPGSQPRIVRPA